MRVGSGDWGIDPRSPSTAAGKVVSLQDVFGFRTLLGGLITERRIDHDEDR